jgi:hypothetical protein
MDPVLGVRDPCTAAEGAVIRGALVTALAVGFAGVFDSQDFGDYRASRWQSNDPYHHARCRPMKKKPSKMYAKRRAKEVAARKKKAADRRR